MWPAGRVAEHALPPDEARAETVFVRRRDRFRSSALAALIAACCVPDEVRAAAE